MVNYWLMKAECDTRLVNGQDVRFLVDDFEACPNGITAWEGVRNHEAKNIMKEKMKLGDGVLFYHSNCKDPGVAAIAEVCKEGHPDHSAWDPKHPYYDPKTDEQNPRWYMVSIKFSHRLKHFVSLALLKQLSARFENESEDQIFGYLKSTHFEAIKSMQLLNRGRLSVQSVSKEAWEAINLMGKEGGWEEWSLGSGSKARAKVKKDKSVSKNGKIVKESEVDVDGGTVNEGKMRKRIVENEKVGEESKELEKPARKDSGKGRKHTMEEYNEELDPEELHVLNGNRETRRSKRLKK